MVGEYLLKCVKTGEHLGDFKTVRHQWNECGNCGRAIVWLYIFANKDPSRKDIILGSECAKNVPKFSYAYEHFKRFKDKMKIYLQLTGKKLSELSPEHKLDLHDIEVEISRVQFEQEQAREKRKKEYQDKMKDFYQRLCTFRGQSNFLDSIRSQFESGTILSENQVKTATRVMDEIEPHIEARAQREQKYTEQVARLKRFVWIDDPDWQGGHGWNHEYVRTGSIHRELLFSFCRQLKEGKMLTEKQEAVITKCETIYRKQLRLNEVLNRLLTIEKVTGVAWEGVKDEFYALKTEYKQLSGKDYPALVAWVSPSEQKKASEGVKP